MARTVTSSTIAPAGSATLPPRRSTCARGVVLLVAAGIAGYATAALDHHSLTAAAALVAAAVLVVARLAAASRARARGELLDVLAAALQRELGWPRPSREVVRVRGRWTRGSWTAAGHRVGRYSPGAPRRLQLHYAAGTVDNDPAWIASLLDTVSRRLQVGYRIQRHSPADRRRCRIRLEIAPPPPETKPVSPLVERAGRAVIELLGPSGSVTDPQLDAAGELTAFTVRHAVGPKLAAAGYRRRIEQVVSTMLPGRWRASWDLEADTARFSIRPNFPQSIWLPVRDIDASRDILASYDTVEIPYGVDEDGNVMTWRPAVDPNVMLVGAPGTGKAADVSTKVPTPSGWTTMGELKDGDVVFDDHGQPCTVVKAHQVRYNRPCYRITFSDRSEIIADAEHLWTTSTKAERSSRCRIARRRIDDVRPCRMSDTQIHGLHAALAACEPDALISKPAHPHESVRSTVELAATLKTKDDQSNHTIRVAAAIDCHERELPIHPYVLGVWLGDGTSWNTDYPSADPEVAAHLEDCGITVFDRGRPADKAEAYQAHVYSMRSPVRRQLRELGLLKTHVGPLTKRIPPVYLRASIQQRRVLLAGLMDTDGIVSPQGTCQFTHTNQQLARDVHELTCSLGFLATIQEGRARLNGRDCGPKWTVAWTSPEPVFKLERKRLVHKERTARCSPERYRHRYIVAVEPVPSVPVRCITVDSPSSLYLVGESFIPTHNTVADHTILVEASRRGWPVWVVDGKSIEFLGFQDWPNVQIVATTIEEQVAVIQRAWEVMEHRYALVTSGRAREADFEPLLIFLDEFADFRSNLMAWYAEIKVKGDPTKPIALSRVASIARKGRTSRVHLVFSTQRPDAEYFGGDMRDNFRMRVSMGRLSPQGAMMMWESPATGTSIPRGCRGRATTINDANRPVEIQTYRTPDPRKTEPGTDEDALLQRLRPASARHQRLLILPPDVEADLDTGVVRDATYSEYASAKWVLASTRPDLDPVTHRQQISTGGRELASPMSIFGLDAAPPLDQLTKDHRLPAPAAPVYSAADGNVHAPLVDLDVDGDIDEWTGYGRVTTSAPTSLSVGDLVLVDDVLEQWAVVDADPEEDCVDPGCIAVSWRGDGDECGALSVPGDAAITVRHPDPETA